MKFVDVENLMDYNHSIGSEAPSSIWAAIDAVPYGIIETHEQYDYIKYYSDHTEVSMDGMKTFEEDKGRCLTLGNYFGGAAFYFETTVNPKWMPNDPSWSYGKYGRIEF